MKLKKQQKLTAATIMLPIASLALAQSDADNTNSADNEVSSSKWLK